MSVVNSYTLTVSHTMSRPLAVDTRNNQALFFHFLLWAVLRNMTKLVAIAAFIEASIDRVTSIFQSSQILFVVARPEQSLTRTIWLGIKAIDDSVLLVEIALEVHMSKAGDHGWVLDGN